MDVQPQREPPVAPEPSKIKAAKQAEATMPSCIGMSTKDAVEAIAAGSYIYDYQGNGPLNPSPDQWVADQWPCAGRLIPQYAVLYAVATEGTFRYEQNGQSFESARAALQGYGCTVVQTPADGGPDWTVVKADLSASGCDVDPGATLNEGSHVTLATTEPPPSMLGKIVGAVIVGLGLGLLLGATLL